MGGASSMTAFLVTVFITGLVLGLLKAFFVISAGDKLTDKYYVAVTAVYWLGLASWACVS